MSRTNRKRLRLEALESRTMLAGNVLANVVGETLFLRGDHLANQVTVSSVTEGESTTFVVTGVNTKINGATDEVRLAATNLVVDLKNGDNSFVLGFPTPEAPEAPAPGISGIQGNVTLKTGSGRDRVTLQNLDIEGSLALSSGSRADTVLIRSVDLGGNATLSTGTGDDRVEITDLNLVGNFALDMGQGKDRATIFGDADHLGLVASAVALRTGSGNDQVNMDHVKATDFVLDLGQGNDTLALNGANEVTGHVILRGGPNRDRIVVSGENNVLHDPLLIGMENPGGLVGFTAGLPNRSVRSQA